MTSLFEAMYLLLNRYRDIICPRETINNATDINHKVLAITMLFLLMPLRARYIPKAAGSKSASPIAASRYRGTGGMGFSKTATGVSGRATRKVNTSKRNMTSIAPPMNRDNPPVLYTFFQDGSIERTLSSYKIIKLKVLHIDLTYTHARIASILKLDSKIYNSNHLMMDTACAQIVATDLLRF
jgi:hypothetical protein